MTRFAVLVPALFLLACGGTDPAPADDAPTTEAAAEQVRAGDAEVVYACPMHPEVVQGEPGDCPECGMHLEEMTAAEHAAMHADAEHSAMDHGDMHDDDHGDLHDDQGHEHDDGDHAH